MIFERFLACLLLGQVSSDWVKLPEITNNSPNQKLVVKPLSSSFLSHSDVVNRIISQAQPIQVYTFLSDSSSTTTIHPINSLRPVSPTSKPLRKPTTTSKPTTLNVSTQKENLKKFIQNERYVTTSTDFPPKPHAISDFIDRESFETTMTGDLSKVKRRPHTKVIFLNQSISTTAIPSRVVKVGPIGEQDSEELDVNQKFQNKLNVKKKQDESEEYDDFEDDEESDEEYEDFEDSPEPPKSQPTPKKQIPQRRIIKFATVHPKTQEPPLSFSNFVKFLKSIQESFVLKTKNNINDKISALVEFRDILMKNIQMKIKRLWMQPNSKKNERRRTKRYMMEEHGHDSGGIDFPSSEAALLTISFLTFSVFLIKLVLVGNLYFY